MNKISNFITTSTPSIHSTTISRQATTVECECKICGASARYSYFGAIICRSCKVFFRRNAEHGKTTAKCDFGDTCEINVNNRRICASCRLAKCFANGMRSDMIRSPWSQETKINRKRKTMTDSIPLTAIIRSDETGQHEQISTSNLLQSDQSAFSIDQWNLLSNLVSCFDEHSGFSFVDRFIHDQNSLPLKLRFKYSSVNDFFTSIMSRVQQVFEKNRDFLSLTLHDRSILLRSTAEYTTSIGTMFILREARLFDYPSFYNSAEIIFRPAAAAFTKRVIDQLDLDFTLIKIIFAILSFSTTNYTVYEKTTSIHLTNIKAILPLQNMYTELAWRYLLYKYDHHQAVKRFSNLIRCLFLAKEAIVEAHEEEHFTNIINFVVEQTEQKLSFKN